MNFKNVTDLLIINTSDTVSVYGETTGTEIGNGTTPVTSGDAFIRIYNATTHKGTLPIYGKHILNWSKSAYAAAAYQTIFIGSNGTTGTFGTPIDGATYTIRFEFRDLWEFCYPVTELQVQAASTGETADTLIDKFVNRINLDTKMPIVASRVTDGSGNYGLELVANDETMLTKVYLVEGFDTDVVAIDYNSAGNYGKRATGSGAEVLALEKKYKGYINNNMFPLPVTYDTATSSNYHIYTIEHTQPVQNAWNRNFGANAISTILAVATGNSTAITKLDTDKMAPWLNAAVRQH